MMRFKADLRSAQIAYVSQKFAPERYSALGEEVLTVDPHTYFMCEQLHKGCWQDDQFIKEFARDNPAARPVKPTRRIFNGFN